MFVQPGLVFAEATLVAAGARAQTNFNVDSVDLLYDTAAWYFPCRLINTCGHIWRDTSHSSTQQFTESDRVCSAIVSQIQETCLAILLPNDATVLH